MRGAACLALAVLAFGCDDDFVRVVVEGSDLELTVAPTPLHVAVSGSGRFTTFDYNASFKPGGAASVPYSDFVLLFPGGSTGVVDLRLAGTTATTNWSGDFRLTLPGQGRTIRVPLFPGEKAIAPTRFGDGEVQSVAVLGSGVVLAWPDPGGVAYRFDRDPDRSQGRPQLLVSDPLASRVRTASRPASGFGPDLAAVVWQNGDGTVHLRALDQGSASNPTIDIGSGSDVHVACAPRGGAFDVVSTVLGEGAVWATLHDATGMALGPRFSALDGAIVRALVGVVSAPGDSFVLATRTDSASRLSRIGKSGELLADATLPGVVRSLALSADGRHVLVATVVGSGETAELQVASYTADALEPAGVPVGITRFSAQVEGLFARISLSDCIVVWPEVRNDGSSILDLRYQYLDPEGQPSGDSHFATANLERAHFAPTAVCASSTRAYVSFIDRTDSTALVGELRLRRVPVVGEAAP